MVPICAGAYVRSRAIAGNVRQSAGCGPVARTESTEIQTATSLVDDLRDPEARSGTPLDAYFQSLPVASFAPSTSASSFAHAICS